MTRAIYRTKDKLLMPIIEPNDIGVLKDVLFQSENGEFMIETGELEELKGKIEPRLFEVLEEVVEKASPIVVTFRIY